MTNTGYMTINQTAVPGGRQAMNGYVETNQIVIQARISERQAEAAGERLAAAARTTIGRGSLRRRVGVLMIHAGQRVAGGQASAGSPAARPTHGMAA